MFQPYDAEQEPQGLLGGMGGAQGGLLGGLMSGLQNNRSALMMAGLGLMGGKDPSDAWRQAMLGYGSGAQMDARQMATRQAQLKQKQEAEALRALTLKHGLDPELAKTPELARSALSERLKVKDPRYVTQGNEIIQIGPDGKATPIYKGKSEIEQKLDEMGETDPERRKQIARQWLMGKSGPEFGVIGENETGKQYGFIDKQGQKVMPIPGQEQAPPANPYAMSGKTTEGERTAAGFSDRMIKSHEIITQNETINQGWGAAGHLAQKLPGGNQIASKERQQFSQAQRDFVNAILRKESGAVISPQEFESAAQQYFPQPGDSAEVIEQKRQNRQTAIEGVARSAGRNYTPPPSSSGNRRQSGSSRMRFDAQGNMVR